MPSEYQCVSRCTIIYKTHISHLMSHKTSLCSILLFPNSSSVSCPSVSLGYWFKDPPQIPSSWMLESGWGGMVSFFVFMIGSDPFRKCLSVWCEERSRFCIFHLIIFTWMLDYPVLHIYIYILLYPTIEIRVILLSLFSHPVISDYLRPHGQQQARPPCHSPSLKVCPGSCSLLWWCHPAISSSDALFCSQSFLASGTFLVSQLLASGGQNTGASASTSVLPTSIQCYFP